MSQNFTIVGKPHILKDKENFKAYEVKKFESGWKNVTQKIMIESGTNSIFVQAEGGCYENGNGNLYLFTNAKYVNGERIKGEKLTVPYSEKKTVDPKEIAPFSKYVIDLGDREKRKTLRSLAKRVEDKNPIDPTELMEVGLESVDGVASALAASEKLRKEYIDPVDFTLALHKMFANESYQKKTYTFFGEIARSYDSKKNSYYEKKVLRNVYLAAEDTPQEATTSLDFFFDSTEESMIENEEGTKVTINGYTPFYNGNKDFKCNMYAPTSITIAKGTDGKADLKYRKTKEKFEGAGEYAQKLSVKCAILDGNQTVKLTFEDLPEELQEMVELEMMTLEDAIDECTGGRDVAGDRVREYRLDKFNKAKPEDTTLTTDDLKNLDLLMKLNAPKVENNDMDDLLGLEDEDGLDIDSDDLPF